MKIESKIKNEGIIKEEDGKNKIKVKSGEYEVRRRFKYGK